MLWAKVYLFQFPFYVKNSFSEDHVMQIFENPEILQSAVFPTHYEFYKFNPVRVYLEIAHEEQAFQRIHIQIPKDPFCIHNNHQSIDIHEDDTNEWKCIQCKVFCYRFLDRIRNQQV